MIETTIFNQREQDMNSIRELLPRNPIIDAQEKVSDVINFFSTVEQSTKGIRGKETLQERLTALTNGERVPIIFFNCISFSYSENELCGYPLAIPQTETETSNVNFYRNDVRTIVRMLQTLGNPDVRVIVPDSEFDTRVMNIPFSMEQTDEASLRIKTSLQERLDILPVTINLLSEFNAEYGLTSPEYYTEQNYLKIKKEGGIKKKYITSEKEYFRRQNISETYIASLTDDVIQERVSWYFGMYAGEGQALRDSKAIVINLEDDDRVATWLTRGATQDLKDKTQSPLPILTPVNTKDCVQWKRIKAELQGV